MDNLATSKPDESASLPYPTPEMPVQPASEIPKPTSAAATATIATTATTAATTTATIATAATTTTTGEDSSPADAEVQLAQASSNDDEDRVQPLNPTTIPNELPSSEPPSPLSSTDLSDHPNPQPDPATPVAETVLLAEPDEPIVPQQKGRGAKKTGKVQDKESNPPKVTRNARAKPAPKPVAGVKRSAAVALLDQPEGSRRNTRSSARRTNA